MKFIASVALKGGVGKTALSVTLAQYAALRRHQRVLFIDTDAQGDSGRAIKLNPSTTLSEAPASHIFTEAGLTVETSPLTLMQADTAILRGLESQPDKHNSFANNLRNNIEALADEFDICIVDTATPLDIRLLSVLVSANYVLSPLELNQEAVSGMGQLLNEPRFGVTSIKAKLNPNLEFLGFLPSKVFKTKFQQDNLMSLLNTPGCHMFTRADGHPMIIRHSTAVAESMASGVPIFEAKKSTMSGAWKLMQPVFDEILDRMGVES